MTATEALKNLITAWETLPKGDYPPWVVERWLREHMKPAIDAARAVLTSHKRGNDQ